MKSRISSHVLVVACCAAVFGTVASALPRSEPVSAQCKGGEYALAMQSAPAVVAGWCYVSADRTVEWWAYIEDVYVWADTVHTTSNPWILRGVTVTGQQWTTYAAWKSDVLSRSAAQGKTIVFQNHSVSEESVSN